MRISGSRAPQTTGSGTASALPANLLRMGTGALGVAAVSVLLVQGSEAAFTASTDSAGNIVESGTVALTDDDAQAAMFNVGNLNGGQTIERCITVTYDGSLTSDIRLHGATSGELAPGLATTIQVGTKPAAATGAAAFDCTGFAAAATTYTGTLAGFGANHQAYATGTLGFDGATKGTSKTYKVTMVVSNDNTFQGKSAGVNFVWEAQGRDNPTTTK